MNYFMICKELCEIAKNDNIMLVAIAIFSTLLFIFVGNKLFQVLQLGGYKIKGYFMWFKETKGAYYSRLFMLTFLSTVSILMTNVLLEDFFIIDILKYIGMIFIILYSSFFITNLYNSKQKTPLKYTKRMIRFIITYTLLTFIISLLLVYLGYMYVPYLSYGLISAVPLTLPVIVVISYYVTLPLKKIISNSYVKKAKKKIKEHKELKVIGITGSYGKTTIKNILNTILSEKYKVCSTPSSYNTPLGLSKTILSNLKDDDEIFIAEMGARHKGDILELCQMVSPSIGIITGIGNQHLLSFKTEENLISAKGELADYITKTNGELYINVESKNAKILANRYENTEKIALNSQNLLKFENIVADQEGLKFNIVTNLESKEVSTSLIGEHNLFNIYICSVVALNLGLSLSEIALGIEKLSSIPHRLSVIKSANSFTIIDDSYNCSVEGSKASLNVLSKFDGKKFVITPGIVELGKEQFNANFEFGRDLANVCDYVIIDSSINYDAISSGLIFAKFDESKIIKTANLEKAVEALKLYVTPSDVVLFENDLPDNYN